MALCLTAWRPSTVPSLSLRPATPFGRVMTSKRLSRSAKKYVEDRRRLDQISDASYGRPCAEEGTSFMLVIEQSTVAKAALRTRMARAV
jgi:hypothetical protein